MPATDRLHGTLDALVLKSLTLGPRHGFGILRWIAERTGDVVRVEEGSLYPALYRMERDGWIDAEWGTTDLGRKAKFYSITPTGAVSSRPRRPSWRLHRRGHAGAESHMMKHSYARCRHCRA